MMAHANEKINKNGRVTDETTKKQIKELLEALITWSIRLQK